ncbi:hypothetical protein [Deinococcus sp.]|uniref:hypothetical protein n=1 Tax=Deinococcus sp. TaxID=47478 RepID=UPI003C7E59D2
MTNALTTRGKLAHHAFMDVPTLPKLDYASPAAQQEFVAGERSVVRHWLRQNSAGQALDGGRLDVARMMGAGGTDEGHLELHRALKRAAREENPDAYIRRLHLRQTLLRPPGDHAWRRRRRLDELPQLRAAGDAMAERRGALLPAEHVGR